MNLARISKAVTAFAAALPLGTGTAAAAGSDPVGYLVAVLSALLTGVAVYLAPANAPAGGARHAADGQ